MRLNKILKLGGVDRSVMIDFFVRLFDPSMAGFVSGPKFEREVDEFFGSGESPSKGKAVSTKANSARNAE